MKKYLLVLLIISGIACKKNDTSKLKPTADFKYYPNTILWVGKPVSFTNYSKDATSYKWDFGDGNTSAELNPSHIYNNTGLYCVQVIVFNGNLSDTSLQCITIVDSSAYATLDADLVAYYPLNGNALDKSSNENNGTIINAIPVADRNGKANSAYYFNGSNSYINVPNDTTLQLTEQISMCTWIKAEGSNPYSGIINKINPNPPSWGYGMSIYNPDQLCGKIYWDHSQAMGAVLYSNEAITDNKWHFVAFTYDGLVAKLYLDEKCIASQPYKDKIQTNSEPLLIGGDKSVYPADRYFKGTIDEVRIYNRGLTSTEVFLIQSLKN